MSILLRSFGPESGVFSSISAIAGFCAILAQVMQQADNMHLTEHVAIFLLFLCSREAT